MYICFSHGHKTPLFGVDRDVHEALHRSFDNILSLFLSAWSSRKEGMTVAYEASRGFL